jgi:hypothetical protein
MKISADKHLWYVSSASRWFVTAAYKASDARREGAEEFGRLNVTDVRIATADEVAYFLTVRPGSLADNDR